MSVKDFVSEHATPDKAILSENNSLPLACFFELNDQEFIVQEYRYLSTPFHLNTGFSIRPTSIDAVKTPEQAHGLFRGEETEALWVTVHGDLEKTLKGVARLIEPLGKNWAAAHVVVLDIEKRQVLEHNKELAKQF